MADRTGTLWEHDGTQASCNHGFASHCGIHVLYRDVLGLRDVDSVKKTVALRWRKDGGKLLYQMSAPASYALTVENRSALELVRHP